MGARRLTGAAFGSRVHAHRGFPPKDHAVHTSAAVNSPFALLLDPQAVFAAVERSQRLGELKSRICRPLDRPVPGSTADGAASGAAEDLVTGFDLGDFSRSA
jgi:hypothetical protein